MRRAASLAAFTLVLLAGSSPVPAPAGEYIFGGFFGPARVVEPPPSPRAIVRRHSRSTEPRVGRKEKEKTAADDNKLVIPPGPLHIVVSIEKQRVTLFANGQPVTSSKVSTGTPGHPTPLGVFTVIEKDRHHFSNLYDSAPMPYMQRITWSGSALHEGALPGYPASHGCVRLPSSFAQLLWKTTKIGARVIITKADVAPVNIDLPDLFARPKTAEIPLQTLVPVKAAEAPTLRPAMAAASETATPAPALIKTADATGKVPLTMSEAPVDGPTSSPAANQTAPEQATKLDLVDKVGRAAAELTAASEHAPATPPAADAPATPEPATPTSPAIGESAPLRPAQSVAIPRPAPARDNTPVIMVPERGTRVAQPAVTAEPTTPAAAAETQPVVLPASPPLPPSRREAVKSGAPISVFVSRKTGKLYVRQKWTPLFEMPVTIANPDQPLGTHVFTAMEPKDEGMRWTVLSIPSGYRHTRHKVDQQAARRSKRHEAYHDVAPEFELPTPPAREALSRVSFPPDAVSRIAELIKPGSSLIISDNRLSDETGEYTDFIVLTP